MASIAALPDGERATDRRRELLALVASTPELAGKDLVTVPYETAAFSLVKPA